MKFFKLPSDNNFFLCSVEKNRVPIVNKKKPKPEVPAFLNVEIKQEYDSDVEKEEPTPIILPKNVTIAENVNGVKEQQQIIPKKEIDEPISVAKQLLHNYGPRLRQNYEIFCMNLSYTVGEVNFPLPDENPMLWSIQEVYNFLSNIQSLRQIAEVLRDEEVDGEALLSMRKEDFSDIFHLPLGIAVKIFSIIVKLRVHVFDHFHGSLNTD